jgi:DNA topoisomerase-1
LQATGRDARQRKQYIYHQRWNEVTGLAKFTRLAEFGDRLPQLRRAIAATLRARQVSRERVLAGMVAVLDLTAIRVGNEEYVTQNSSYGLASLRNRHITVGPRNVELRFRAKGGFQRSVTIDVPAVVRVIRDCAQLNGSHVFQYLDENESIHAVTAGEVNDHLKLITGEEITAKDFRTWKASAFAVGALFVRKQEDETAAERKRTVRDIVCQTAEMLSNTPAVCRNYYIHPGLLDCYERGKFLDVVGGTPPRGRILFTVEEQLLSRFLKNWPLSVE